MNNQYSTGHPTRTQGGYLILKIALGIVLAVVLIWCLNIAMSLGGLALFAKLLEANTNKPAASKTSTTAKVSPLNITGQPTLNPIQRSTEERTKQAQKAVNEAAKEYQNILDANEIYHRQHPDRPRISPPPMPNYMAISSNAYNENKPTATDDTDPHSNPIAWDSIQSKDKICWFHKTTRRKVCEGNP